MQRGLFRLWIIFACLFVIVYGFGSSAEITRQFRVAGEAERQKAEIMKSGILPVPCSSSSSRGKLSSDYSEQSGRCWYDIQKFKAQYPEYKRLNTDQLFNRFCQHAGISMALAFDPSATLMQRAGTAVGIPIAVFILGWSFLLAYFGFRAAQSLAR